MMTSLFLYFRVDLRNWNDRTTWRRMLKLNDDDDVDVPTCYDVYDDGNTKSSMMMMIVCGVV